MAQLISAMHLQAIIGLIASLMTAVLAAGCASFDPVAFSDMPIAERALEQEQSGLTVRVAALSKDEARRLFSANLHKRGVQPVWIEIENNADKPFWFMQHGLDPNYFSAREVAYMNHYKFAGQTNRQMDAYFSALGIQQLVPVGATVSGFAFTNEVAGTREINVLMYGDQDIRKFEFFAAVPGSQSEWDARDYAALYANEDVTTTLTETELQAALQALPCCTTDSIGFDSGAPLNVVLIGGPASLRGLIKAGWDESIFRRDFDTLFDSATVFGRTPDVQFEKPRRLHKSLLQLRVWRAPITHRGEAVWVGSVRRSADADVDDAAYYLLEDLASLGAVARFGLLSSMAPIAPDSPRRGVGFSPYWTNGKRLVLFTTSDEVAMSNIEVVPWVPIWESVSRPTQQTPQTDNAQR